jgi:hypothetical protein
MTDPTDPVDPAWIQAVKRMYRESPTMCIAGMTFASLALVGFLIVACFGVADWAKTGRSPFGLRPPAASP